jgi:putative redox protein
MSRAVARRRSGLSHTVEVDGHELIVDELPEDGGNDHGIRPTRLLAASLASCTAVTIAMYADRKEWDIEGLEVAVEFDGTPPLGDKAEFDVEVSLPDGLDDDQRARLMVIAGKCPVHRMLVDGSDVALRPAAGAA